MRRYHNITSAPVVPRVSRRIRAARALAHQAPDNPSRLDTDTRQALYAQPPIEQPSGETSGWRPGDPLA